MNYETYLALKIVMNFVNVRGIPNNYTEVISSAHKIWDWLDEVGKEYDHDIIENMVRQTAYKK